MTHDEYAAYQTAFETGMTGLSHFSSGSFIQSCTECPVNEHVHYEDGISYEAEPYFSWSRCEICDTTLGGDREDCHAIMEGDVLIHLRVCTDCVYYAEYGRLPDAVMAGLA